MTCRRSQVRVLYRAPRVCDILDVTDSFFVVSPRTGKADVENEIRRGGEGRVFPCCVCRGDHWSPANLPPQRIFRDSCLVRQAGTGEQCSPLQEFSPVWARNIPARRTVLSPTACGRSPLAEGAKRGRCPAWSFLPLSKTRSVGAHSICARGGLSYRKRARADMESAPTFFVAGGAPPEGPRGGRVFACCACKRIYLRFRLVKNHLMWYTISLQVHRQTRCKPATQSYRGPSGQPVANKKLLFYCRR